MAVTGLYAEALLEAAGPAAAELPGLAEQLAREPGYARLMDAPVLAAGHKHRLLREAFGGRIPSPLLNLLFLLADNRRFALLPDIAEEVQLLLDERNGVLDVVARTAAPLSPELETKLKDTLERKWNRTVRLTLQLAPELIGGLQIRCGEHVIDGSVRGRLDGLRRKLLDPVEVNEWKGESTDGDSSK